MEPVMSQDNPKIDRPWRGPEAAKTLMVMCTFIVILSWAMMAGLLYLGGGPGNIFVVVPILATAALIHIVRKQHKTRPKAPNKTR